MLVGLGRKKLNGKVNVKLLTRDLNDPKGRSVTYRTASIENVPDSRELFRDHAPKWFELADEASGRQLESIYFDLHRVRKRGLVTYSHVLKISDSGMDGTDYRVDAKSELGRPAKAILVRANVRLKFEGDSELGETASQHRVAYRATGGLSSFHLAARERDALLLGMLERDDISGYGSTIMPEGFFPIAHYVDFALNISSKDFPVIRLGFEPEEGEE